MPRALCLVFLVLCLAGCFAFNNPYEFTAQFQIILQGGPNPGTYVWNSTDNAYEAMIGSVLCKVYMDSSGYWHCYRASNQFDECYTFSYSALPPTSPTNWMYNLFSVDDSAAGISGQAAAPDAPITLATTPVLNVAFLPSEPGNTATYQWVRCASQTGPAQAVLGTGPTYALTTADIGAWIRVIVTPADSSGKTQGAPVTSPPVYVSG